MLWNNFSQSKYGPGSVLRPGAMCSCPVTGKDGKFGARLMDIAEIKAANFSYCAAV